MKNNKEFTAEQMLQINKMLNKANAEMNRKENLTANISRIAEKEIFKNLGEVEGFEEYSNYEISTFGRVKSVKFGKEKILKPRNNGSGYLFVDLSKNGNQKKYFIHRLVAAAFCTNNKPEIRNQVNHINHNPKDNFYKNLEWVSPSENQTAFNEYDAEAVATRKKKIYEAKKGLNLSEETRRKLSEAKSGENNPNFGKHHSDETKKKISDAQKLRFAKSKKAS